MTTLVLLTLPLDFVNYGRYLEYLYRDSENKVSIISNVHGERLRMSQKALSSQKAN